MLCLVIDRNLVTDGRLLDRVEEAVEGGVDRVQVRERGLPDDELLELTDAVCETARSAARAAGHEVAVVVNRRADVALAAGADGVHLGFDGMDSASARLLLGPGGLIGVSCHLPAEPGAAPEADYAHLAPVFAPLSKATTRAPLGLAALGEAARHGTVLAQGGVDAGNAGACIRAGAAGVAVTGAILLAPDPREAARSLRTALDGAARSPGSALDGAARSPGSALDGAARSPGSALDGATR